MTNNQGWVSVGIDHDTADFAANSIRRWWEEMGSRRFPRASELMITADGGGSNGYRSRLWKVALQELADQLDFKLKVCHFPPGTSKWNKIEHRLFSYITSNWRGQPLGESASDREPDRQHNNHNRIDSFKRPWTPTCMRQASK